MGIELILAAAITAVAVLLAIHAWCSAPDYAIPPETVVVGLADTSLPPPPPPRRRDVLDDFANELGFEALTAESSAEHRLALLDALLDEAEHETVRLEFLVNKMGDQLVPAA